MSNLVNVQMTEEQRDTIANLIYWRIGGAGHHRRVLSDSEDNLLNRLVASGWPYPNLSDTGSPPSWLLGVPVLFL